MTKFGPPTKVMLGDVELPRVTEIEIGSMEPRDFYPSPLAPTESREVLTYDLARPALAGRGLSLAELIALLERWMRGE